MIVSGDDTTNKDNGEIIFRTAAAGTRAERMRIDSSGNVGIGDSNPGKALSINGNDWNSSSIGLTRTGGGADNDPGLAFTSAAGANDDTALGGIWFNNSLDGNAYGLIRCRTDDASGTSGKLEFMTGTSTVGNGTDPRMLIDSVGRVMIGTASMPLKWWNGTTMGNQFLVEKNNTTGAADYVGIGNVRNSADGEGPQLGFGKSRGTASGAVTTVNDGDTLGAITFQGGDGTNLVEGARILAAVNGSPGANDMPGRLQFYTTADGSPTTTERMRIDSSGNIMVGSSSNLSSAKLYVKGTKSGTGGNAGQLVVLDDTAYSTTDNGGAIQFAGNFYDGGQVVFATVQGVKSNNTDANSAGDLIFTTKAHGGNQTERMRIDSSGNVLIGRNSVGNTGNGHSLRGGDSCIFSRDATGESVQIGRNANDGQLIQFRDNGTEVGDIRVDGTTVSLTGFAGNHESSGISESTETGTVVSTIDELDTRKLADGSTVDHKNHAKIKVSDSVGDKRVYGVLNKFVEHSSGLTKALVTSVGISSIRVTGACEGGDLLESNGDGTAKVQSDDIIRSKTIGKVTIGNSDTGVKLVSCVLYCG